MPFSKAKNTSFLRSLDKRYYSAEKISFVAASIKECTRGPARQPITNILEIFA